jgi:Zn-dependent protease
MDSGILPQEIRRYSPLAVILGIIQGAFFGLLMVGAIGNPLADDPNILVSVPTCVAALVLSILIHELGHLTCGWLIGFCFSFISVGPLTLKLVNGRPKVLIRRERVALGYAGMHIDKVRRLRQRMLFYAAAGSVAQLFFGVVAALAARIINVQTHPALSVFLAQFAAVSMVMAFVSLVPFGCSSTNDGSRIARLLTNKEYARRRVSLVSLGVQQRNGIRPKDWKQTWLRAALLPRDDSRDEFAGNWLAYVNANARKDKPLAGAYLERCLELSAFIGIETRNLLAQEAAVYCAWFRQEAGLAEKWLGQAKKTRSSELLPGIRMRVAMRCVHHDFNSALDAWNDGMKVIEKLPENVNKKRLREGWIEWCDEIRERQAESSLVPSK